MAFWTVDVNMNGWGCEIRWHKKKSYRRISNSSSFFWSCKSAEQKPPHKQYYKEWNVQGCSNGLSNCHPNILNTYICILNLNACDNNTISVELIFHCHPFGILNTKIRKIRCCFGFGLSSVKGIKILFELISLYIFIRFESNKNAMRKSIYSWCESLTKSGWHIKANRLVNANA